MNQKRYLGASAKKSKDNSYAPPLAVFSQFCLFIISYTFQWHYYKNNVDTHCKLHIRVKKPFYVKAAQPSNYENTWANLTGL